MPVAVGVSVGVWAMTCLYCGAAFDAGRDRHGPVPLHVVGQLDRPRCLGEGYVAGEDLRSGESDCR